MCFQYLACFRLVLNFILGKQQFWTKNIFLWSHLGKKKQFLMAAKTR